MREKFVYPENMLDKNQIMDLVFDSSTDWRFQEKDKGDLAGYAEMHFGPMIFDEGFSRYQDFEVRDWYYREYLPDRETDIANGYDRGQ